jgi:hypothetical protein
MVSGLRSAGYEDRLRELGLTTLEELRHRADMLQMFKIINGAGGLEITDWFELPTAAARTRQQADPLNVRPNHGRLEIRQNFFSVRAGARWNEVPPEIKRARTATAFKRLYSAHRHAMI